MSRTFRLGMTIGLSGLVLGFVLFMWAPFANFNLSWSLLELSYDGVFIMIGSMAFMLIVFGIDFWRHPL